MDQVEAFVTADNEHAAFAAPHLTATMHVKEIVAPKIPPEKDCPYFRIIQQGYAKITLSQEDVGRLETFYDYNRIDDAFKSAMPEEAWEPLCNMLFLARGVAETGLSGLAPSMKGGGANVSLLRNTQWTTRVRQTGRHPGARTCASPSEMKDATGLYAVSGGLH